MIFNEEQEISLVEMVTFTVKNFIGSGVSNALLVVITSILYWLVWNWLTPIYLTGIIPEVFLKIPYWHMVGFSVITSFIGKLLRNIFNLKG